MNLAKASKGRQNNLNIIRLIASLLVLYMHSIALCVGIGRRDLVSVLTLNKESAGGLAVDIFFLISGFLICKSYHKNSDILRFIKARALRIWPILIVVVIFTTFIIGPVFTTLSMGEYFTSSQTWKYILNIFFMDSNDCLPGVFGGHFYSSVNGSLWTLRYEVMCYALVVILAPIWKRVPISTLILSIALGLVYMYWPLIGSPSIGPLSGNFILNFTKLASVFLMGMFYYLFRKKILIHWIFAIIALAIFVGLLFVPFFSFYPPLITGGCYLIMYLSFQKKFVSHRYEKLGDLSYGIYIMSFPIQQMIVDIAGEVGNGTMNFYVHMLLTLLLVVPLAILSWHLVEEPCIKLKDKQFFHKD